MEKTNQYASERPENGIIRVPQIVDAIYVPSWRFDGNKLIEALPKQMEVKDIRENSTVSIRMPSQEEREKMSTFELADTVNELDKYRFPLPFIAMVEVNVHRVMTTSYSKRKFLEDRNFYLDETVQNQKMELHKRLVIEDLSNATPGFALLGASGCGKTTAINMTLAHYPQVIIHNRGKWDQFAQITYIVVSCKGNNNFSELYVAIGKMIDKALCNLLPTYENYVRKRRTLGEKYAAIVDLVEKFAIGLIVFDEIELIDFKSSRESSVQSLMTLVNETGVGIAAVGTPDAYARLTKERRIARRFGDFIPAQKYCSNRQQFGLIMQSLSLYQWVEPYFELTTEITDAFFEVTGGVISEVIEVYKLLQRRLILAQASNKPQTVTPETVRQIAKEYRKEIERASRFEKNPISEGELVAWTEIQKLNNLQTNEEQKFIENQMVTEYSKANILREYLSKKANVTANIKTNTEYKISAIERAFDKLAEEKSIWEMTNNEIYEGVIDILSQPKAERKKKEKSENRADQFRAELLENNEMETQRCQS